MLRAAEIYSMRSKLGALFTLLPQIRERQRSELKIVRDYQLRKIRNSALLRTS